MKYLESTETLDGLNRRKRLEKLVVKNTGMVVRYADDFIIITNNQEAANEIQIKLTQFLKERGLEISQEKSHTFQWKMGEKFNYLGWIFHIVKATKVNWITKAKKNIVGRLSDWSGLYVYLSKKSIQRLRDNIKLLTSRLKINKINNSVGSLILKLSSIMRGWFNYFIGGKQGSLRVGLDNYINLRVIKFLRKKFKI